MSSWPRLSVNASGDGTSAASSRWASTRCSQTGSKGFGTTAVPPSKIIYEHLVGTIVFDNGVVQDSVDQLPTYYVLTPAAAKGDTSGFQYVQYNFALSASANESAVVRDIVRTLPTGQTFTFNRLSVSEGEVNRSVRPVALGPGSLRGPGPSRRAVGGSSDDRPAPLGPATRPRSRASLRRQSSGAHFRRDPGSDSRHLAGVVLALLIAIGLSSVTLLGPVRPLCTKERTSTRRSCWVRPRSCLWFSARRAWWRRCGCAPGRSGLRVLAAGLA